MSLTYDDLKAFCLSMTGAHEDFPFGADVSVFKVKEKMFALLPMDIDPQTISLKCDPAEAMLLREQYEGVIAGYHLNKKHWNTVTSGRDVPDGLIEEMIEDSYHLVVKKLPKRDREELT